MEFPSNGQYLLARINSLHQPINPQILHILLLDFLFQESIDSVFQYLPVLLPLQPYNVSRAFFQGQTGSDKEFFFNNIYSHLNDMFQKEKGTHFKLPLRKTNIAAYSGELTYSELFGHKKGAFTGAEFNRQGILEEAHG